jgi:hypothetical protein
MLTALIGLLGVGGIAGLALHLFGWAGTLAKMTSFGQGAKSIVSRIPRWAWIALAVVALLVGGYLWINHKIHQAYANGSKDGHAAQFAHDQAEMDKVRARARAFKLQLDTANTKIHNEEQARHDQVTAANRALADALRLRVGTKAQPGGRGVANLSGAAAAGVAAGGSQPPADAGLGQGADRPLVCVDAGALIDYAEQADDEHDALVKQEDAQKRYKERWPSATASPTPE